MPVSGTRGTRGITSPRDGALKRLTPEQLREANAYLLAVQHLDELAAPDGQLAEGPISGAELRQY
jgi:hypothetical protein